MDIKIRPYSFRFNSDLLLAFIAGVITSFVFPPYDYLLAAIPAFSIFVYLIFNNPSRGFVYGLLFGLGQFFFAFHWLMPSMTEYGQIPVFTAYLIFFAVCLEVALYPALFSYVLSRLTKNTRLFTLLLAPAIWVLTEWLRSNMFPFAWNLIGYSFYPYPALLQVADIGSVYLLSFLFVFYSTAFTFLIFEAVPKRRVLPLSVLVASFVLVWAYGVYKIDIVEQEIKSSKHVSMAAVQGNINQKDKWRPESKDKSFEIYTELTRGLLNELDLIVWPESTLSLYAWDGAGLIAQLKSLSEEKHADLLMGIDTYRVTAQGEKFFNSMLLINEQQGITGQYDKFHRVPFGEYMPMKDYLPDSLAGFMLNDGFASVEAGKGVAVLPWRNLKLAPLICYESIFPRHARAQAVMGADIYVNVANDAWFGEAVKPQHLLMTRLRAIENRRPLVRVSNTGITAMFDAAGNEIASMPSLQRGVISAQLPLSKMTSVNAIYGQYFIVFCLLIACLALVQTIRGRKG